MGLRKRPSSGDNSLVAEIDDFLSQNLECQVPTSRLAQRGRRCREPIPNVPAFLAGHPQHMRRSRNAHRGGRNAPLIIYMIHHVECCTSMRVIRTKEMRIVLLALVRMLIEHRAQWSCGSALARVAAVAPGSVAWRIDTAPMDLARSAYHIGAAAMARGFGYGMDDPLHQTPERQCGRLVLSRFRFTLRRGAPSQRHRLGRVALYSCRSRLRDDPAHHQSGRLAQAHHGSICQGRSSTKSLKLAVVSKLDPNSQGKLKVYRVVTIKNSVVYHPGQELCKAEVEGLCDNAAWDITVVGSRG